MGHGICLWPEEMSCLPTAVSLARDRKAIVPVITTDHPVGDKIAQLILKVNRPGKELERHSTGACCLTACSLFCYRPERGDKFPVSGERHGTGGQSESGIINPPPTMGVIHGRA